MLIGLYCGLKNYAKNMGWERTSGTPMQFASSTNPQIYGLVVGYYARFLEEHKLVTNNSMLKQFTATGECKDAADEHGQPIPATIACLNLQLLLYNTKLKPYKSLRKIIAKDFVSFIVQDTTCLVTSFTDCIFTLQLQKICS